MKFTLSWLKEHLDTAVTLDGIVEKLTMIGLEVESVDDPAEKYAAFRLARVLSAEKHPNADRLRVCVVDPGDGSKIQVVCGAPNARAGMTGVFAPAGTYIPGTGVQLEKGVIRGVESNGMLLSERELGVSDDHEGIVDLPDDAPVGQAYAVYAGLDDPVIDVAVTPNRPDALGVSGIARDLAAAGIGYLIERPVVPVEGRGALPGQGQRSISATRPRSASPSASGSCAASGTARRRPGCRSACAPSACARSTRWSISPTSSPTTATARCMSSTPPRSRAISSSAAPATARSCSPSTAAPTRSTRPCASSPTRTASNRSPASSAAKLSGCSETTTDVLIESALWEPLNIAQTGRKLGVNTDARYRYERGIDPAFNMPGLELATRMVMDLCGGTPSEIFLAGEVPRAGRRHRFPGDRGQAPRRHRPVDGRGERHPRPRSASSSKPHRTEGTLSVTVPSWRPATTVKADLVEEVVRIIGVDRVPPAPLAAHPGALEPMLTLIQTRTRRAKRALAARGLVEAVTWSFIAHDRAAAFGGGDDAWCSPIRSPPTCPTCGRACCPASSPPPSAMPIAATAISPCSRSARSIAATGRRIRSPPPPPSAAAPRGVDGSGRHWSAPAAPVSVFDAKADALALLDALGLSADKVQVAADAPAWYHPGRSGTIRQGPKTIIGTFGEFHPKVLELIDADGPLAGFELILEAIPAPSRSRPAPSRC